VPAYNAQNSVGETLRSVLGQTYGNIEVVVVDDGSQDRTAEIVETIAQQDHRVKLLRQTNQGVAAARNLAIQESHGEYIAPIDADDIWYPQKLEKQVECLQKSDPTVGLVYAWSVYIDQHGRLTGGCVDWNIEGWVYLSLLYRNFIGHASAPLIRRGCLQRVGGYCSQLREHDGEGCEDRDLYLRIAEHYRFRVVPEFLIGYRQVTPSMSCDDSSMVTSHRLIMADVQRRHPEIPPRIFRWSKSRFYWYLGQKCYRCGHYWHSLSWLFRAAWFDPVVFLHGQLYRLVAKNVATLVVTSVGDRLLPKRWRFGSRSGAHQVVLGMADVRQHRSRRSGIWHKANERRLADLAKLGSTLIETSAPMGDSFGTVPRAARRGEEG
jgi:glycosyltransferase involved in cell wall biosynthesis